MARKKAAAAETANNQNNDYTRCAAGPACTLAAPTSAACITSSMR